MKRIVFALNFALLATSFASARDITSCALFEGNWVGQCNHQPVEYSIQQDGCESITINGKTYVLGQFVNQALQKQAIGYETTLGHWSEDGKRLSIDSVVLAREVSATASLVHRANQISIEHQNGELAIKYSSVGVNGGGYTYCQFKK